MENGHRVLLLDVYEGMPSLPDDPDTLFRTEGRYTHHVSETVPDLEALRARFGNGDALIGKNVLTLCRHADRVFLALHGAMGENGQMQATLDSFGIRYTGSGYAGSLLAMDKDISKRMLRASEVLTPDWIYEKADSVTPDEIIKKIGLPAVIKPCSCGSSVGISIVNSKEELILALELAAKYEGYIIAEKKIEGREFTMAMLDGNTLPPVEIIPKCGFYDYKNKYQKGATVEICPAPISDAECKKMSDATKKGFAALRLDGYARFDYIMDNDGDFYCLEANTLPGMTPTSLMPQEAAAAGISYDDLCDKIAKLAYAQRKN
jgi:D-alanine-D-alanine ligase